MADNTQAFKYSLSAKENFTFLASPMLEKFGATGLSYCKTIFNDKRLYLHTNESWIKLYCERKFEDAVSHADHYIPHEDMHYSIERAFKPDIIAEANLSMGLNHGFNVYRRGGDYYEFFCLFTSHENQNLPNLCINNLDVLNQYIDDFRKKAGFILNHRDQKRLISSEKWNFSSLNENKEKPPGNINNFLNKILGPATDRDKKLHKCLERPRIPR